MEEDVTHIHDKDRTVKMCVEFYEELFRSRRLSADQDSYGDLTTISTINPPSIQPSIKRLKRNKARREDNVTGGNLQDGGDAMTQVFTDIFSLCLDHRQVIKSVEECSDYFDT